MPKRSKPGDEEESTTSKKRKSVHEDAAASDVDEVSAPPKKKIKESKKNDNNDIEEKTSVVAEKKQKARSTPSRTRATPSRSAAKRGKAADATLQFDKVAETEVLAVTVVKEKKISALRVENLRIPSHQTPGKHPVGIDHDVLETETTKVSRPPRMRLNLDTTNDKKSTIEETKKEEIDKSNYREEERSNHAPVADQGEETSTNVVEATEPIWAKRNFLVWGLVVLHLILSYISCGHLSNLFLYGYKNLFGVKSGSNVAMEREISPAEVEAIERTTTQLQLLDFNMARLKKGRDVLFTDLPNHQQLIASMSELTAFTSASWTNRLEEKITSAEKLIAEEPTLTMSTLASIRELLGGEASEYLLDLEHIHLWNINTNLTECGQTDSLTEGRVLDAQRQLLLDLQEETNLLMNNKQVEKAVMEWFLKDTKERFEGPVEVPSASVSNVPRGSSIESIRKVIQSRMDVVSADLTGKVDYAAISSGGGIIKTGKYATTPSIVDTLPYVNRLLHTLRLRFYGHGPEAAIMPTYPVDPSKALGNCWSFVSSPSELGKYAVFSVSFANPIYATQVAIEHPPRDVNDRAKASIRAFRVVGFESSDATGKAWDMGQFEYRLGDDYLQVFDLEEEEMGNAEIPAIQSLSLLIDSNWGLGYSCLYRLRVHGHQVENNS